MFTANIEGELEAATIINFGIVICIPRHQPLMLDYTSVLARSARVAW